jgi:hypothetical protein
LKLTVLHAKGGAVRWFQVTRACDDWPQERTA